MDYEQTLLFFTVIQIIRVILYKSKYFFWIFPIFALGFTSRQLSLVFPWLRGLLLYILKRELQT
jgi:hypothetical protein